MAAAMGVGRFAYTPLLPQMTLAEGWTYAQSGDVASANFLGYLVGALMAPALASSHYVRLWVAMSIMLSAGTTYLGAEISGLPAWLTLRFLSGVASAFCLVIMTGLLMQTLRSERAEHLGNLHFAGVGVGILLCMAATYMGGDVAEQWARQGLVASLCMAIAWFAIGNVAWPTLTANTDTHQRFKVDNTLWRVIVGYGLFGFGYVIAATFVVAMGERLDDIGMDAGVSWVVVGAATVPSVYLWQWLANTRGLGFALVLAYLVLATGVLLAGMAETMLLLLIAAVLLGGTFGGITALGLSAGRALSSNIARVVSAMTVAFSIGQLLGPAVAGRMADLFGSFFWPSALACVLLLVSAALVPRVTALRIGNHSS